MKPYTLAILSVILGAPAVLAETAQTTTDHSRMGHSNMSMSADAMEGAVHTKATLNSLDGDSANVSHEPIPEIGWPAMTMDLAVLPDALMTGDMAPGDAVTLMLVKGEDGMYAISGIMPE